MEWFQIQDIHFSFLLNEKGDWLDSHDVGIDGILLYRDEENVSKIHGYILSFERHSFVGHFVLDIPFRAPLSITQKN